MAACREILLWSAAMRRQDEMVASEAVHGVMIVLQGVMLILVVSLRHGGSRLAALSARSACGDLVAWHDVVPTRVWVRVNE